MHVGTAVRRSVIGHLLKTDWGYVTRMANKKQTLFSLYVRLRLGLLGEPTVQSKPEKRTRFYRQGRNAMSKKLAGKVALVTEGSRGIGAAIAKRLAADGANLAVTYTKAADAAATVVKDIERQGR